MKNQKLLLFIISGVIISALIISLGAVFAALNYPDIFEEFSNSPIRPYESVSTDQNKPIDTPKESVTDIPSPTIATSPKYEQCPRPYDAYGQKYETKTGLYLSRDVISESSYQVQLGSGSTTVVSVIVTKDVYDKLGSIQKETSISLFSYVSSSMSGANPPFSCLEI